MKYHSARTILSLSPNRGPIDEGTSVLIEGSGFQDERIPKVLMPFCKFGVVEVPAKVLSNTNLTCRTPPVFDESELNVSVSLSLRYLHSSGRLRHIGSKMLMFYYSERPTVISIDPVYIPSNRGVLITITGNIFRIYETGSCQIGHRGR